MHWTVHQLELGRTLVEAPRQLSPWGIRRAGHKSDLPLLQLEVYDGGGFTPSHGVWRLEGKVAAIVEAARA